MTSNVFLKKKQASAGANISSCRGQLIQLNNDSDRTGEKRRKLAVRMLTLQCFYGEQLGKN